MSALDKVRFATDGNGKPLSAPVSLLIAANWDLGGATQVFSRDDATGAWTAAILAQDQPIPGFLPQVRSFGRHRDRVTGVDLVFAGQDPRGAQPMADAPQQKRQPLAHVTEPSTAIGGGVVTRSTNHLRAMFVQPHDVATPISDRDG